MTKGFVTIATGQERYFELARNLLRSYRLFASEKYPFAIICDKKNQYTEEFDDVILLDHAYCNYLDKLQLYEYLPYDETIFIDADSLAYGDLDEWWYIFRDADDFSLFGYMWTNLDSGRGWFVPSGLKEYQNQVTFIPDFNGGIYYMRRGEICKEVFRLANYFAAHFGDYTFNGFAEPADEPVLALAMAIQNCHPLDIMEGGMVFAPSKRQLELDITVPSAHYRRNENQVYHVNLIHWSNYRTKLALYRFEVEKMSRLLDGTFVSRRYNFWYQYRLRYYFLCIGNIRAYVGRLSGKIKRVLCR